MHQFLVSVLLLLICLPIKAQNTILYGKALDYTGKEIIFYVIPDPVLHQKHELATTRVASDGAFSVTIPINQTVEIYCDLEKYCGIMVVEPNKNYSIELPPFSIRSSAEARSIYFKPAPFWLGLPGTNNSDLNFMVRSFVTEINFETVKNTSQIYQQKSKVVVDEIIERLEKKYSSYQNEYFRTLKRYYFAELEYALHQRTPDYIINKYFAGQPVQLNHPIYQRVFEILFTDFLRMQAQHIQNRKIITATDAGDFLGLVSFFEKKGYQKEFAELVVLKGLNDGYYTGSFSKEGVIKSIEMAQQAATTPALQAIARQIKSRLTLLPVGGKAPSLKLNNTKMEAINLDQVKGKFVYLTFFNSTSSDCRMELDSIVSLERKFRQVLTVLSVALDDDFDNPSKLWKTKGYSWELLNGSKQKQLIINYNVTIPPAYYLIDPDGNLLLAQAPSPTHGFEPLFLKIFRSFNFKPKPNPPKLKE